MSQKAKDLVEKMLGEAGEPGRQARYGDPSVPGAPAGGDDNESEGARARRLSAEADLAAGDEEDEAQREAGDDDDGDESDPTERFAEELYGAVSEMEGASARTFDDVGMLTNNKGLVVRTPYGEFQVTIVRSR